MTFESECASSTRTLSMALQQDLVHRGDPALLPVQVASEVLATAQASAIF